MKIYNKLIRDNIPEIIRENGQTAYISTLDDARYLEELRKKLGEEVGEFLESGEIEELADILEVIEALAAAKGSTLDDVMNIKREKARRNGAFNKRLFLEKVEERAQS